MQTTGKLFRFEVFRRSVSSRFSRILPSANITRRQHAISLYLRVIVFDIQLFYLSCNLQHCLSLKNLPVYLFYSVLYCFYDYFVTNILVFDFWSMVFSHVLSVTSPLALVENSEFSFTLKKPPCFLIDLNQLSRQFYVNCLYSQKMS